MAAADTTSAPAKAALVNIDFNTVTSLVVVLFFQRAAGAISFLRSGLARRFGRESIDAQNLLGSPKIIHNRVHFGPTRGVSRKKCWRRVLTGGLKAHGTSRDFRQGGFETLSRTSPLFGYQPPVTPQRDHRRSGTNLPCNLELMPSSAPTAKPSPHDVPFMEAYHRCRQAVSQSVRSLPVSRNNPGALVQRDSERDGSFRLPVSASRGSPVPVPECGRRRCPHGSTGRKRGGCPIPDRVPIRGIFCGFTIGENLKPGSRGPVNHYDPLFPRLGFR